MVIEVFSFSPSGRRRNEPRVLSGIGGPVEFLAKPGLDKPPFALHGADGHPQGLSRFLVGQTREVAEIDDGALSRVLGFQLANGFVGSLS